MITLTTILSCKDQPERVSPAKTEIKDTVKTEVKDDPAIIQKSGISFYDWYFSNGLTDYNIIKNKNYKAMLDTATYFKRLRALGTLS